MKNRTQQNITQGLVLGIILMNMFEKIIIK